MNLEPHKTEARLDEKTVKEIHFHFVHQQVIKRGHLLFRFNTSTGILEVVPRGKKTYEKHIMPKRPKLKRGQTAYIEPQSPGTVHSTAPFDPASIYFGSLNMENAQKKINTLVGYDLGFNKA